MDHCTYYVQKRCSALYLTLNKETIVYTAESNSFYTKHPFVSEAPKIIRVKKMKAVHCVILDLLFIVVLWKCTIIDNWFVVVWCLSYTQSISALVVYRMHSIQNCICLTVMVINVIRDDISTIDVSVKNHQVTTRLIRLRDKESASRQHGRHEEGGRTAN